MVEGATTTALALGSKWQEQLLELVTTNLGWFLGSHNHYQAGPGVVIFFHIFYKNIYRVNISNSPRKWTFQDKSWKYPN